MTRKAINSADLPEKSKDLINIADKRAAIGYIEGVKDKAKLKKFDEYTPEEKDELLRAIAIELGYIKAS